MPPPVLHALQERQFNRRFLTLANHYLFEPVACTPASGWEKGQVENQVGTAVLNNDLHRHFERWYPGLKIEKNAERPVSMLKMAA